MTKPHDPRARLVIDRGQGRKAEQPLPDDPDAACRLIAGLAAVAPKDCLWSVKPKDA